MKALQDQWILITGASRGLGRVLALEFAKAGGNLILAARNAQQTESLKQQVERLGVRCLALIGDITRQAAFEALVKAGLDKQVEIVVNNAGVVVIEPLEGHSIDQIDRLIELDLTVPIKLTRALLPMFKRRKSGTIINVNSAGGKKPVLHHTVYCAAKYGLNGFAEALKLEVKQHGIRVFNVSPGKMATELFAAAGKDWDTSAFIPPEEVAAAVVSLVQMSPRCGPAEIAIDRMG